MSRKRHPSTLGEVIQGIAGSRNWQEKIERHRLFSFWEKVVGKDISQHARPKLLRGAVLWVDVTDSVWMQQLHLQKTEIMKAVNDRLDKTSIDDIRFQLVKGSRFRHGLEPRPKPPSPMMTVPVQSDEVEDFEKLASEIGDQEIRKSLRKLWMAQKMRNR